MSESLAERIERGGHDGYAYAYPHKTAYRTLDPPVPLQEAWSEEDRSSLFLYVHLPFCEMRCGFCNLFTTVQPAADFVSATLDATRRQSEVVAGSVQPESISRAAFGGGTPSLLSTSQLQTLFDRLAATWPVDWADVPVSFETSPGTVDAEKCQALRSLGVDRLSIGVQSFVESELSALGRPPRSEEVRRALTEIRQADFPVLNIDLIYGMNGQTEGSWHQSLERALEWEPEELYLYPLYVRELTGLGKKGRRPATNRRRLQVLARDLLESRGYEQVSLRLFRRSDVTVPEADYCCQEDGMVGLGPGARSYTSTLHYSTEYAVGQAGVRRIISDFVDRPSAAFGLADFGVRLEPSEQRRRYLIKSLLRTDGLDATYRERFGAEPESHFPELAELTELGLCQRDGDLLRLTRAGLELSDTIGPWLYSESVQRRMAACETS
ncbi:MAG: STM4012 family radical SAM protein [Acidobacteriota bacterium]